MRILTLQLRSDDGKRVAETSLFITDGWQDRLQDCLDTITHRLDVLERDGPWKPEQSTEKPQAKPTTGYYTPADIPTGYQTLADVVKNSLQPAPKL